MALPTALLAQVHPPPLRSPIGGSGRDRLSCTAHRLARARPIDWRRREHNFQESSCAVEIEELRQCCQLWREKSLVCSGIDVTPPEAAPSNKKPSAAGSSKQ
ncbi:Uncharacterized protein GBIM_10289 [Gryllus bimaculatus]|nr:Uncharacterized protein GBIM_10289 [Gryllus bimaculatus]